MFGRSIFFDAIPPGLEREGWLGHGGHDDACGGFSQERELE
jgi:hypothetical protein